MYAELDVADRIGWAKDSRQPFSEVREVAETPASSQRAVTIYDAAGLFWVPAFTSIIGTNIST